MAEFPSGGSTSSAGTLNSGEFIDRTYYQTGSGTYTVREPKFVPASALLGLPQKLFQQGDFATLQQINKLVKDGGFSSWEEAIQFAANDPEKGSRSWQDYLSQHTQRYQAFLEENGGLDGSGTGSDGGPFSDTSTQTTLSSESGSASMLDEVFRAELGRTASEPEVRAFMKALNRMQSANPSTTVMSGNNDGDGNTTRQSTTTGGFDPTRFAQEWARSRPEYAEVQAATSFMSLLDRAIDNPNAIDQMIAGN